MISAVILVTTILGQKSLFPADAPYHSRAEFYDLNSKVKYNMSKEEVVKILGRPDRVTRRKGDLFSEVLEYGIDSQSNTATLGAFVFRYGKFYFGPNVRGATDYLDPENPYVQLISETELRPILGKLAEKIPEWLSDDPIWTIKSANLLIKLGDRKAKYVLGECERMDGFGEKFSEYKLLLDLLFSDPNLLPDLPIIKLRDVSSGFYSGPGPSVQFFRERHIRTKPIHPPSDPFEAVTTAFKEVKSYRDLHSQLDTLLKLVRGTIQPHDYRIASFAKGKFEVYHQLFLSRSPSWNAELQSYMGTDGKVLPDWSVPQVFRWAIPGMATGTEFEITISRVGDSGDVSISIDLANMKDKVLPNMIIRAIDTGQGIEVGSWQTNALKVNGSGRESRTFGSDSPEGNDRNTTFELPVPVGTKIQLEVFTPSGTNRSSEMRL